MRNEVLLRVKEQRYILHEISKGKANWIGHKFRNTKKKIKWIGHTLRKEDGEIPKAALLWNPQGNRMRGRTRNSWRRSVIKETGRSWNELRFLAADRQK